MVEILVNGNCGAKVIPLADDRPLVIGRRGKLRIDDRQISRQHARVIRRDDAWYVEDLGSKNGTFINQVRVTRTERVEPGDTIRIGNTSIVVRQAAPREEITPALPPVLRHASLEIPDRVEVGKASLARVSTTDTDAGSRRWGPIVLVGMTLALLVSILFNAISYARTVSVLRGVERAVQQRAEQRDLELIAALRSDLRKPPAGFADLTAALDRAASRRDADEASRAAADRAEQQFVQLHRSTSGELAEIRRALDELGKKLDAPPSLSIAGGSKADHPPPSLQPGRTVAEPVVTSDGSSSSGTVATETFCDVVFVIDASGGLRAALPKALAQVRLARSELSADQSCRILVAREFDVAEIPDQPLTSTPLQLISDVTHDTEEAHPAEGRDITPLGRAITLARTMRPRTLHLFTDHSGKHAGALNRLFKTSALGGASVNITHFYTREFREDLKALARDHGGVYSFVGSG